tara:strand:- start:379 stop:2214 length:1836 start_codon:yes stop_codon:yes gene_type:complete
MNKVIGITFVILCFVISSIAIETMDEIIVKSTRIETPLDLMTSSIDIITKDQLIDSGEMFVSDALELLSGVQIIRDGGPGQSTSVYLRGAKSQHTLLYLDGVKIVDQLGLNGYDLANVDVASVDRIEILKGPQSTLYGSDAMGGVINIITDANFQNKNSINYQIGSYGTQSSVFKKNYSSDDFYINLNASYFEQDGFSAKSDNQEDDGLLNKSLHTKFGSRVNDLTDWSLSLRKIIAENEYDPSSSNSEKDQLINRFEIKTKSKNEKIIYNFGASYFELNRYQDVDFGTIYEYDYESETKSYDFNVIYDFNNKSKFFTGVDSSYDEYTFDEGTGLTAGKLKNTGLFGSWQYKWNSNLILNSSVRRDNHSKFDEFITYQGSLAYIIDSTKTKLRVRYGTGFKAPISYYLAQNSNLNPEENKGWEIGFDQPINQLNMYIDFSIFSQKYDNFISYLDLNNDTDYNVYTNGAYLNSEDDNYYNVDKAESNGLELGGTLYLNDKITFRSSYSYLDNDSLDSSFEIRRPTHKFNSSVKWDVTDKLMVNSSIKYIGSREDSSGNFNPYKIINLNTRNKIKENCYLTMSIKNLLDEEYTIVRGYNTPGISFFGGLNIEF